MTRRLNCKSEIR